MINGMEDFQKMSKGNVEMVMQSANAWGQGFQALATEAADYSKKSFESGVAAAEKLFSAGSLDKAMEVHSDYVRSAYEGYVGQATKMGEIVTDMAKAAYKPYEGALGKFGK